MFGALVFWFLNFNSKLAIAQELYFKRGEYEDSHPKKVTAIRKIKDKFPLRHLILYFKY